jgi:threonine aldolase
MSDEQLERFRAAVLASTHTATGHRPRRPADVFRALADACVALDIDRWDQYGERGPVELVEREVAELLGTGAAAYFPSGVMAQQSALRVWCDRAASRRVALPDLSHLLLHELDGPRLVHGFEVDHLTTGAVVATAEHLAALPGRIAAALVELPLREPGCLLPSWDELTDLSTACRERGVALHVDGARIWEAAAGLDRSPGEIAGLADSVYVSFYKGLGGLAGCALAGPADVVDEARRWRRRLGGTLFRMTPETVAALVGLRDELPLMGRCLEWARDFAAALPPEARPHPAVPHTNTFLLHAAGDADVVNERLIAFVEEHGLVPTGFWFATDEPGRIRTEMAVGSPALELDPAEVAAHLTELLS